MVYAFCVHLHDVSLPAIACQNSLKQMNSSYAFFFFTSDQRGNFGPGIKVFWGQDQRKPRNKEVSLLNNKPKCLSLSKSVLVVFIFFFPPISSLWNINLFKSECMWQAMLISGGTKHFWSTKRKIISLFFFCFALHAHIHHWCRWLPWKPL